MMDLNEKLKSVTWNKKKGGLLIRTDYKETSIQCGHDPHPGAIRCEANSIDIACQSHGGDLVAHE